MNSSTDLPICAFCTFVNPPESKICLICKKSLKLPEISVPTTSAMKTCLECSFSNDASNAVCQMCGVGLRNVCAQKKWCYVCGKCLPSDNYVKVCKACTYHNTPDAMKCLICQTKFESKQKAILSKVCPFCNHDNALGVECAQCTFTNTIGSVSCVMCRDELKIFKDEDVAIESSDGGNTSDDLFADEESLDGVEFSDIGANSEQSEPMDVAFLYQRIDENIATTSTTIAVDNTPKYEVAADSFEMLETAPPTHRYFKKKPQTNNANFLRAVSKNIQILKSSVPSGVWIKAYEDRMDLLSFMIVGPAGTPYENGLFIFDIYLPSRFPSRPPKARYMSFWDHRLNPNLYVNGRVCVSLLGTWSAERKEEEWGPKSTLLQLIVSIQGLILVEEPYYNEPGNSDHFGRAKGIEGSAKYNEKVTTGMIVSTMALIQKPPLVFKKEILLHFAKCRDSMYERLWRAVSTMTDPAEDIVTKLQFFRIVIDKACSEAM